MSGYSSVHWNATFLPIVSAQAGSGNIAWTPFQWGVKEDQLLAWSQEVLDAFEELERAVNRRARELHKAGRPLRQGLTLSEETCLGQLKTLARYGKLAYRGFFPEEARQLLLRRIELMKPLVPAPTFVSSLTPFPWEVLYQGDDQNRPEPDMFWGFGYSPARILDLRDVSLYVRERDSISKMLFCLHHRLRKAHQEEWPTIKRLVKVTRRDDICLLGPIGPLAHVKDGESLLTHLYKGNHNMLHFACHARQREAGNDALLVSLVSVDDLLNAADTKLDAPVVELDTDTFVLTEGSFLSQPLVFMNACHSGGGADELRDSYNLPRKFIERGAGAVLATACPVPDVFAAEFARVFYGFFLWGQVIDNGTPEWTGAQPMSIGEALRQTRRYFLEKHNNPLGLAYGLYSPAHYQVARPLAAR